MNTFALLKATGLQTANNIFTAVPEGGLAVAKNVVVNQNGIVEPRRGQKQYTYTLSTSSGVSNVGAFFGNSLVVQYDSTLAYDTESAFTTYSGTFAPVDDALLRMKFVEARQNLYANSSTGIRAVSTVSGTWRVSGLPRPYISVATATATNEPALAQNSKMGVRAVFVYTDENSNEIVSEPSQREILDNATSDFSGIEVVVQPEPNLPTGAKLRLYGTVSVATGAANDPGDEHFLFYESEAAPAGETISLGSFRISDRPLYTNSRTGEGIEQANTQAPVAKDITAFQSRLWAANTTGKHRFFLELVGVGATAGVQNNDTITIGGTTFTAKTSATLSSEFQLYTSGTVSQNVDRTARNLVAAINDRDNGLDFNAYYLPTSNSYPGTIVIEARTLGTDAFTVYASRPASWSPELTTSSTDALTSDNNRLPHGLFYSKPDQPEAFPLLNYLLIGAKNKEILRVVPLRDKLYSFKEDGIFTVAGDALFRADALDATARLICPDSVAVLANQIYCFTTQGVCTVSDSGVQIISRAVETEIAPYLTSTMQAAIKRYGFGVANEFDRTYELWLPSPGATDPRVCNKAFVYNAITNAWTTWERERTWGVTSPSDLRHYGGPSDYVYKERKDGASSDYADETVTLTLSGSYSTGVAVTSFTVTDASNVVVGDSLQGYTSGDSAGLADVAISAVSGSTITVETGVYLFGLTTVTIDKAIDCDIRWLPIHGGMPGQSKRYAEAQLHFSSASWSNANAVYNTETSPTDTTVALSTSTGWGEVDWGEFAWGQPTQRINTRHLIPTEKQRGAYLTAGFKIREAFSTWKLQGLSLEMEAVSQRNSR